MSKPKNTNPAIFLCLLRNGWKISNESLTFMPLFAPHATITAHKCISLYPYPMNTGLLACKSVSKYPTTNKNNNTIIIICYR